MTSPPAPPARTPDAPPPGSRRAEIALVAAEEFTRRGYHATRVEHIAERLSVTPGALYRHVPGKYEMFRDAVATLIGQLDAATAGAPSTDLDHLVGSVTRTTLAHRSRAALHRWQVRYLTPEDRAAVRSADARVQERFAAAVRARRGPDPTRRPGPGSGDPGGAAPGFEASGFEASGDDGPDGDGAMSAAGAILACIASLCYHRIEITEAGAVALMTSIAADLAASDPPPGPRRRSPGGDCPSPGAAAPVQLRRGAATREGAISAAIARFHSSGYDDVTMEAIGADVGVAASALYRHFSGKSALLTAAVDRTATLVGELLDDHAALHSSDTDPAEALIDLLHQYTAIAFSHGPELILYHSELGILDPEDRQRIRRAQRRQLDRWAGLLLDAVRADGGAGVDQGTARIRVHAALAVVLDGGQSTGFHQSAAARFGALARIPLVPGDGTGR